MAANSFRVALRMRVKPGCAEQFEQVIGRVAARVAANPGNLGQGVYRDCVDASVYHVFSDWTNAEAFWEHERSTEHRTEIKALGPLRDASQMVTMDSVGAWADVVGADQPSRRVP